MQSPPVVHSTFVLERTYPAKPDKVFAALSDPTKKRRWYADDATEAFEMDFRVGGAQHRLARLGADTPFPGVPLTADGVYLDIVPGERVVVGEYMALGDRRISAALATFELLPDAVGTRLVFTHQGAFFEGSDGPERREGGWNVLLDRLSEAVAA
jgi:uncharacterized protein YndB with AHSA1/START domain